VNNNDSSPTDSTIVPTVEPEGSHKPINKYQEKFIEFVAKQLQNGVYDKQLADCNFEVPVPDRFFLPKEGKTVGDFCLKPIVILCPHKSGIPVYCSNPECTHTCTKKDGKITGKNPLPPDNKIVERYKVNALPIFTTDGYKELLSTRYKCHCGITFGAHNAESMKCAATSYAGIFRYHIGASTQFGLDRKLYADITARVTESPHRIAAEHKEKQQTQYVLDMSHYYSMCKANKIIPSQRDGKSYLPTDQSQPRLHST
jgi:hypothetical protein